MSGPIPFIEMDPFAVQTELVLLGILGTVGVAFLARHLWRHRPITDGDMDQAMADASAGKSVRINR